MKKKVTKAIFPVAGLGTRFLPATKSIPKEILSLVDRPLIQYAIDEAREAGIEEFIFVTSRGKSALSDYFDGSPELERALEDKGKFDLLNLVQDITMCLTSAPEYLGLNINTEIPPSIDTDLIALRDVYSRKIENAARSAYDDDYRKFGFHDWKPKD